MPGAALLVILGSLVVTQTLFGGALERLGVKALVANATSDNPLDNTISDPIGSLTDLLWPF